MRCGEYGPHLASFALTAVLTVILEVRRAARAPPQPPSSLSQRLAYRATRAGDDGVHRQPGVPVLRRRHAHAAHVHLAPHRAVMCAAQSDAVRSFDAPKRRCAE